MGFTFAFLVIVASLLVFRIFGIHEWSLLSSLVFIILGTLPVAKYGHRTFRTGGNTDLLGYVFIIAIASAIFLPNFQDYHIKESCKALEEEYKRFSSAQDSFFKKNKRFALSLNELSFTTMDKIKIDFQSLKEEKRKVVVIHDRCYEEDRVKLKKKIWIDEKIDRKPMSTVSAPREHTLKEIISESQLIMVGEFLGLKKESKITYFSFKKKKILLSKLPEGFQGLNNIDIFKEEPIIELGSFRPPASRNYRDYYAQSSPLKKRTQYILFLRYVDIDSQNYFRLVAKDSYETLEQLAKIQALLK